MLENLTNKKLILASKSPRRHELLKELGLSFEIKTKQICENFPNTIDISNVAAFLAKKKADAFELSIDEIIITSDTTVLLTDRIFNKPKNSQEALEMLQSLSGKTHEVCTGVCIKSTEKEIIFSEFTKVTFKPLSLMKLNTTSNTSNHMIRQDHTAFKNGLDLSALRRLKDATLM